MTLSKCSKSNQKTTQYAKTFAKSANMLQRKQKGVRLKPEADSIYTNTNTNTTGVFFTQSYYLKIARRFKCLKFTRTSKGGNKVMRIVFLKKKDEILVWQILIYEHVFLNISQVAKTYTPFPLTSQKWMDGPTLWLFTETISRST